MAITLEEAVEIGYRSVAVATACAKTMIAICNVERNKQRGNAAGEPPGQAKKDNTLYWRIFQNLCSINMHAVKFYETGDLYDVGSVKDRLEKLWVTDLGNALVDLPDWDYYSNLSIATPLTFTQQPTAALDADQLEFVDNSADILNPQQPVRAQVTDAANSLIEDLWKAEGMRRWLAAEVTLTGETQAAQDEWNFIQNGTADYWVGALKCLVKLDDQIGFKDNANYGKSDHDDTVAKFQWIDSGPGGQRNNLTAAGGLYALDQSQLFGPWNGRRETVNRPKAK